MGCGGKVDYMCERIESHCVECVCFRKASAKIFLGQLRKLWALRGGELLYLDRQKTSDFVLVLFASGLGRDAVHTKERSRGHSPL